MTPDLLNSLDIFSTLDDASLARVRLLMKRHEVPGGWILFREGDEGNLMYVVRSGTVAISINTEDGREIEVARVGEGSFFGEMSILEKDVRSATCSTVDNCVLLSLDSSGFRILMKQEPEAAISIMQRMLNTATGRLQKTGAFLSDMVKWGEGARIRAVTDVFTGLYNRRFFDEVLEDAVMATSMGNSPFSLVMLDLDRFGTLNAEYGEEVGDAAIKALVPVLREAFSENDILARYGGDEFAFILPGTDGLSALERCRKAGEGIRTLKLLEGRQGSLERLTASIGIAECPIHGETVVELLDRSDRALYSAKEAGRDTAMLYTAGGDDE